MDKKEGYQRDKEQISRTELSNDFTLAHSDESVLSNLAPAKMMLWLIIASPIEHRGTVLPIADGAIIGRQGDIPRDDARMSRKHARFIRIDDPDNPGYEIFAIKPEKSRNGTRINGKRIKVTTPLRENDVIIMGDTRFVVKVLESATAR